MDQVSTQTKPAYRVWKNVPPAERQERLNAVIKRVVNDESTKDIAADLGISRTALNMALLEYAEEDWKRAQIARAISRLEKAQDLRQRIEDKEEESSSETLTLARDAEKSAQWMLEKLCRRLFGDVPQVVINHGVSMDQALDGMAQALLDKMRVVSTITPESPEPATIEQDKLADSSS